MAVLAFRSREGDGKRPISIRRGGSYDFAVIVDGDRPGKAGSVYHNQGANVPRVWLEADAGGDGEDAAGGSHAIASQHLVITALVLGNNETIRKAAHGIGSTGPDMFLGEPYGHHPVGTETRARDRYLSPDRPAGGV